MTNAEAVAGSVHDVTAAMVIATLSSAPALSDASNTPPVMHFGAEVHRGLVGVGIVALVMVLMSLVMVVAMLVVVVVSPVRVSQDASNIVVWEWGLVTNVAGIQRKQR